MNIFDEIVKDLPKSKEEQNNEMQNKIETFIEENKEKLQEHSKRFDDLETAFNKAVADMYEIYVNNVENEGSDTEIESNN